MSNQLAVYRTPLMTRKKGQIMKSILNRWEQTWGWPLQVIFSLYVTMEMSLIGFLNAEECGSHMDILKWEFDDVQPQVGWSFSGSFSEDKFNLPGELYMYCGTEKFLGSSSCTLSHCYFTNFAFPLEMSTRTRFGQKEQLLDVISNRHHAWKNDYVVYYESWTFKHFGDIGHIKYNEEQWGTSI